MQLYVPVYSVGVVVRIAPLVPLLLGLSASAIAFQTPKAIAHTPPPQCHSVSVDTPAATSPQRLAIAKSWENARLIHNLPIQSVNTNGLFVFSQDGQTLATGSYETEMSADKRTPTGKTINTIKLWNINTGELIRTLSYLSTSEVKAITFSPDGQMLASSGSKPDDRILTIKLWDLKTGQELQTFRRLVQLKVHAELGGSLDESSKIAFTPDSKTLISISGGNPTIQLWDVKSQTTAASTSVNKLNIQKPSFSSKQQRDTQIHQKLEQAREEALYTKTLLIDQKAITAWLDDGYSLETIKNKLKQQSPMLQHWRQTRSPAVYKEKSNGYVEDLTRQMAQQYVYIRARTVVEEFVKDTTDGSQTFVGQGYIISSKGNNFTVAANEGSRVIFQMQDGKIDLNLNISSADIANFRTAIQKILNQGSLRQTLTGHSDEITSFVISPDSQILASGSKDKTIKLWNLKTGQLIHTLNKHLDAITALVISSDGELLASGSKDKTIKLWNLKTGKLIRSFSNTGEIHSIVFNPDAKNLIDVSAATADSMEPRIHVRNLSTGKVIRDTGALNWRSQIAINPDGKTYAIAGNALILQLSDLITGKVVKSFGVEAQGALFTPDGKSLVTVSGEGIKIWQ
jgi:WD40 repeat protein